MVIKRWLSRIKLVFTIALSVTIIRWFQGPFQDLRYRCGDLDYEITLLQNWWEDFHKHRPHVSGNRAFFPNCFDLWFYDHFGITRAFGRRWYLWNDELERRSYHTSLPSGTTHVEGHPLNTSDLYVSVAAMSFFGRRQTVDSLLSPRSFRDWRERTGFTSYLYLHHRSQRISFRNALHNISNQTIPQLTGGHRNDCSIFDEAVEIQKDFRFCIEFDSSERRNYITEKLVNGFLAGCIPIFWGHSETAKRFFNEKSFVDVRDFISWDDAARHVWDIQRNHSLARQYLSEPPMTQEGLRKFFWWRYPKAIQLHEVMSEALQPKVINSTETASRRAEKLLARKI